MANTLHDSYDTMEQTPDPIKRPSLELPTHSKHKSDSRANRAKQWFVSLAVLGVVGTAGVYSWPHLSSLGSAKVAENWITEPAVRQRLVITVNEDGNIESASNVDVKCEVLGGSTILWIVEDGKQVEAGEEIVRLDESAIDTLLNTQKIAAEKAEALKIQAEQDYEAAKIAVEEYEKGLFVMEQQTLEANVKIALENLRGAENLFNHTQVMFRKGFVTKQQLEADEFGVQRSELELKSAETALKNLREFTKLKMTTQLKAVRDAAEARKRSEEAAWNLEVSNVAKLKAQKEKCVILAPQGGMVIHANERDRRSSSEVTIKEGAAIRERQSIIQLPDLTRMQVKAKIHESKVELLKMGMPARVTVQDRVYKGKVVAVANQPEPGGWFSASVKEYAATVAIDGAIDGLKPGMTAEVEIFVADISDALTVNVSAVVEQGGGKFAVWVVNSKGELERRPVLLGRTNENVIEIKDGIVEDEMVVLNPRAVVKEAQREIETESEEVPAGVPTGPDAGLSQGKPLAAANSGPSFKDLDKDNDKKLSKDEAPERMQQYFDRSDTDKDGFISLSEWAANQQRRKQAQANGNGPGGPQGGPGGPQGGPGGAQTGPGGAGGRPGGAALGGESE